MEKQPPAKHFQQMRKFDYDVAVLGGGSAGYAAARTAADAGLKTVVIEGGEEVGGLCILRGCMPTKALLYAAEVMHLVNHPQPWGIHSGKCGFDFKKVMARKNALIEDFAQFRRQQLGSGKFKFIRANAKFLDAHTVGLIPLQVGARHSVRAVQGKSGGGAQRTDTPYQKQLTAGHFIIATGSTVAPSPLPQLDEIGCITSDEALALGRLPNSLIILGGGPTACEFAQFFSRFGVKVTLIQRSEHILKEFDTDTSLEMEKVFRREGIRVFTGTKLLDARLVARASRPSASRGQDARATMKSVSFEQDGKMKSVSADEILFALGRIPNTAGLDLEKAGVKTESSRIVTDEFMRTSAPHIHAAGDCTGPHEIVHIAVQQGEIAARNIAYQANGRAGSPLPADGAHGVTRPTLNLMRMDYRLLISVVFTEPQIAFVGLTEKEAVARKVSFLTAGYPFNDHGKSLIMEAKDGFVKLLADPKSGEILGGGCVGPVGGELIHEIAAAMAKRMTVHELAAIPHYHPTLAEIWTYPAEELAEKI